MSHPLRKIAAAPRAARRAPFEWLAAVAQLPGKSLHLGLALSWLAEIARSPGVRLTRSCLQRFSISRDAAYDGLRRLENARLIRVWRLPGRAPHIVLLGPDGLAIPPQPC